MKKLFLIMLLLPLFFGCKKDSVVEPLVQLHFINFVDGSGNNLFETQQISTSSFYYGAGSTKETWEELMVAKRRSSEQVLPSESKAEIVSNLANDDITLLEVYQGNLERERVIFINEVSHNFRFSVKDGFFQNGQELDYTTETIEDHLIFLHHIVLEDF